MSGEIDMELDDGVTVHLRAGWPKTDITRADHPGKKSAPIYRMPGSRSLQHFVFLQEDYDFYVSIIG
jgi:hypothetical protein